MYTRELKIGIHNEGKNVQVRDLFPIIKEFTLH